MPAERTSKGRDASKSYPRPPKKVKPALPVEKQLQKRWKSMKDQIGDGYLEKALKTCRKALELDPSSELANHTYIQLLLSLDRYNDTLEFIQEDSDKSEKWQLESCYALYKLGRESEAGELLSSLRENGTDMDNDEERVRTLDVLEAQIRYRTEDFKLAREVYDDLLTTVEIDSPEYADLTTNLSACNEHLDFISSIPSRLADLSSSSGKDRLPPIDVLESTPVAQLVSAHPSYRTRSTATTSTSKALMSESTSAITKSSSSKASKAKKSKGKGETKEKKTKTPKLPKSIAALPEGQRPAPDPERWLPKRERKGYAEVLAAKEREKEKRKLKARKKLEASMTQGAAAGPDSRADSPAPGKAGGTSNNSQKSKAKKKGGKR